MRIFNLFFLFSIALFFTFTSCQKEALEDQNALAPTQTTKNEILQLDATEASLLNEQAAKRAANAAAKPTINLQLENGNELHFYEAGSEEDYVVIEVQKCTDCSVSALGLMGKLGDAEFAAKDIYWAFSEPGTAMPSNMTKQQSFLAQSSVGVQGWAKKELQEVNEPASSSRSSQIACNNYSFKNSISGGFLSHNRHIKLDLTARYNFQSDCLHPSGFSKCVDASRHRAQFWWNGVKKWAGKICAKSVQTSYNNHYVEWCGRSCSANPYCDRSGSCKTYYGPEIRFELKQNNSWRLLSDGYKSASYEVPPNETWTYGWHSRSNYSKSFRMTIRSAKGYDQFDAMMDASN